MKAVVVVSLIVGLLILIDSNTAKAGFCNYCHNRPEKPIEKPETEDERANRNLFRQSH